jgi:hypothetical protein
LQLTLHIYPRSLQEHSTSMNSVPCAYFRVSLHDYAIHSSRWVDFADFGLVGFRFFVWLVKMRRAFINETTARLRCVRVFVKLRSVVCVTICCLPHMAIMCHHERGSKDIFRPHTEAFACWRCAFFIPWTAGVNIFSRVCESGLRDEHTTMRVAHGDTMVARETRSEWIRVRRKSVRFLTTRAEVTTFSLLRHAPPCTCVCESRKTASLKISEGLYVTILATGNQNQDPNRPENDKMRSRPWKCNYASLSTFKCKGARNKPAFAGQTV